MKFAHVRLAVLAAAAILLAGSPAFAEVVAVCTAKDSAGRSYTDSQTGIMDFSVRTVAEALALARCRDGSKKPRTCQVASCQVTKKK